LIYLLRAIKSKIFMLGAAQILKILKAYLTGMPQAG
jgi:hypothetical protein